MKILSSEAKVGIFTIIGALLFALVFVFLTGFNFSQNKYKEFSILYSDVTGLKNGANVSFAGIYAGKVIKLEPYENKIMVVVEVDDNLKIPENSIFTIGSDGLMGERFVSILPPEKATSLIKNHAIVVGLEEKGIDYLISKASNTIEEMQILLNNMNKLMGNKETQNALTESALNLKELTYNMKVLTEVLASVTTSNEGNLDKMISDMTSAMKNLNSSSKKVERMLNNLEPVIADPETAKSLKQAITLAGNLSAKADGTLNKLKNIKTKKSVTASYITKEKNIGVSSDISVFTDDEKYFRLSLNDIGRNNPTHNLEMGTYGEKINPKFGIIESKLGAGLDFTPNKKDKITLEVYNPKDISLNLSTQTKIKDNIYLVAKGKEINKDKKSTYIGLKQEF